MKTTPKKKITRTPKARSQTGELARAIPPLAIAISTFADPHNAVVSPWFTAAYARVPAMIADYGEDLYFPMLNAISGLADAERQAEASRTGRDGVASPERVDRMAEAVAKLLTEDEDLLTDLTTPILDASFQAGIAFACYVLLEGQR